MASGDAPQPLPEVLAFYARGLEHQRLSAEEGLLERYRTQELLLRYLPPPPAVVLDVGGGTGHYARWLAARGYEVHLIDPVPLHLEQARAAEETRSPLASIRQGDARQLDYGSDQADAVLLFGPLYHLPARSDRLRALREARRLLRADGLVLAVAISRFASALDGLVSHFFADPRYAPAVWQDLTDGQHRGLPDGSYFTTAYLHQPEELAGEMSDAGFGQTRVLAIEGPAWLLQDFEAQWTDPILREALLEVVRRTESEPSLLGASSHLLGVGRKIAGIPADG